MQDGLAELIDLSRGNLPADKKELLNQLLSSTQIIQAKDQQFQAKDQAIVQITQAKDKKIKELEE